MSQNSINVFAKWRVKEGQLKTVIKLLAEMARETRLEEGNMFYEVFQNNADPDTIIIHEAYADQAAAENHRHSEHFQNIGVAKIIPLLKEREVTLTSPLIFDEPE